MARIRRALVYDNVVANIYEDEETVIATKLAPVAAFLVECPVGVQPGWRYVGGVFTDPIPPPNYRDLRRDAYLYELQDSVGDDAIAVTWKVLDIVVGQIAAAVPAGSRTAAFSALLSKISEIKARIPES